MKRIVEGVLKFSGGPKILDYHDANHLEFFVSSPWLEQLLPSMVLEIRLADIIHIQ